MKLLATFVVVALVSLPSIFAGWPAVEPAVFDARVGGVPVSVIAMVLLMAIFVGLASVASGAARRNDRAIESGAE